MSNGGNVLQTVTTGLRPLPTLLMKYRSDGGDGDGRGANGIRTMTIDNNATLG